MSVGATIELFCNTTDYNQNTIGWYAVKEGSNPIQISNNHSWNVSSKESFFSLQYSDYQFYNLTIFNINENDFASAYFCYDKTSDTYLTFVELVDLK